MKEAPKIHRDEKFAGEVGQLANQIIEGIGAINPATAIPALLLSLMAYVGTTLDGPEAAMSETTKAAIKDIQELESKLSARLWKRTTN